MKSEILLYNVCSGSRLLIIIIDHEMGILGTSQHGVRFLLAQIRRLIKHGLPISHGHPLWLGILDTPSGPWSPCSLSTTKEITIFQRVTRHHKEIGRRSKRQSFKSCFLPLSRACCSLSYITAQEVSLVSTNLSANSGRQHYLGVVVSIVHQLRSPKKNTYFLIWLGI